MYYFDSKLLQGYIDQKKKLQVFDGNQWLGIADFNDLEDAQTGIGYDTYGKSFNFDYRDITQIKVGNRIYTLEMLQQFYSGEEPSGDKKPTKSNSKESEPEPEPKTGKEPDLSWFSPVYDIGKQLMKEARRKRRAG